MKSKSPNLCPELKPEIDKALAEVNHILEVCPPEEQHIIRVAIIYKVHHEADIPITLTSIFEEFGMSGVSSDVIYGRLRRLKGSTGQTDWTRLIDQRRIIDKHASTVDRYAFLLILNIYDVQDQVSMVKRGERAPRFVERRLAKELKNPKHFYLRQEYGISSSFPVSENVPFVRPTRKQIISVLGNLQYHRDRLSDDEKECLTQILSLIEPPLAALNELWIQDSTRIRIPFYDEATGLIGHASIVILCEGKSRRVLNYSLCFQPVNHRSNAGVTLDAILEFGKPRQIQTDNISYTKKYTSDFSKCLSRIGCRHTTIRTYSPWENGILERINSSVKGFMIATAEDLCEVQDPNTGKNIIAVKKSVLLRLVEEAIAYYNNSPHGMLNGLSPLQVYEANATGNNKAVPCTPSKVHKAFTFSAKATIKGEVAETNTHGHFQACELAAFRCGTKIIIRFPLVKGSCPPTAWYDDETFICALKPFKRGKL